MRVVVLLGVAAIALALAWWAAPSELFDGNGLDPSRAVHRSAAGPAAAAGLAEPAARVGLAVTPERAEVAVGAGDHADGSDGPAAAPVALPPPGQVKLRVLDATTREPLADVRVRFMNQERFAEYQGGGEFDAPLTPGTWQANVMAAGYEPEPLDGFDVAVGETTELGTLLLQPGDGAVEGRVVAHHVQDDPGVVVELHGDGRAPCDRCRTGEIESSTCCGYTPDVSRLTLQGDRSFRFPQLGAGTYWLRAFDPAQRIVPSVRLELGRHGRRWCELDVTAPTLARIELRHENGARFVGAWANPHREKTAGIHFRFKLDGREAGEVVAWPHPDDVRASLGPPILLDPQPGASGDEPGQLRPGKYRNVDLSGWIAGRAQIAFTRTLSIVAADESGSLGVRGWSPIRIYGNDGDGETRLDRERQESDALAFDFSVPALTEIALTVEAQRPDLFLVQPLPRELLTLQIECGDYISDELLLDLRFDPFAPRVVALHLKEELRARQLEIEKGPPASCSACHDPSKETDPVAGRVLQSFDLLIGHDGTSRIHVSLGDGRFELTDLPASGDG